MTTLYENFLSGSIMDDPLLVNATIINSMDFATIPVVTAPDIMWMVLDPKGLDGSPEIIKVISHVALTTKITCIRAQQSTAGREHAIRTDWAISLTKEDITDIYTTLTNQLTTQLANQYASTQIISGRRNLLDNGQFLVNQRALSSIASPASSFIADRWSATSNAVGTQTLNYATKAAFGVSVPTGRPQPANYQWLQTTVIDAALAAGDFLVDVQWMEGQSLQHLDWGTANAKSVTVSFDIYSTSANTFIFELINNSATFRSNSRAFTVAAATFTTVTLTLPGDTGQAITNDTGQRLGFQIFLAAGSTYTGGGALNQTWALPATNTRAVGLTNNHPATVNNVASITNCQLEIGSAATIYQVRPYPDELLTCKRYLQVYPGQMPLRGAIASGGGADRMGMVLPVEMRAPPTLILQAGTYNFYDGVATLSTSTAPANSFCTTLVAEFGWSVGPPGTSIRGAAVMYQAVGNVHVLTAEI